MRVINNNTNAASEKNSVLLKIWIESMLKVQDSRIMGMSENVFKLVCDLIGIQFLESRYVQKFAKKSAQSKQNWTRSRTPEKLTKGVTTKVKKNRLTEAGSYILLLISF